MDDASSGQLQAQEISDRFYSGARLSFADGLELYRHTGVEDLGRMADWVRWRKHPERIVTYIVGRNINYTNVCWVKCKFCAFYRPPGSEEGYVLTKAALFEKIQEMVEAGGIEILIQGGLNPRLKIDYYEDLFRSIKQNFKIHIHGLSAPEILYIAHLSRIPLRDTIAKLRDAGLDTIPGAGGEILNDEIRSQIAPRKDTTAEWLSVHSAAHSLGMRTTATMMYGSLDRIEHRLEHLMHIRELQDRTGGFTAFIIWNFQPDGTELGGTKTDTAEYLRMVTLSRILLDNVENIQASWVTQGVNVAQTSLRYGVNDFGSTMFEENVVRAAGTSYSVDEPGLRQIILDAGFEPRRRNTLYQFVD
jgi:cyclic dehypoxanthinyl futalosine synthase